MVTAAVDLSGKSFTIMVWVKRERVDDIECFVAHGSVAADSILLYFDNDNKIVWNSGDPGMYTTSVPTGAGNTGEWHHVTIRLDTDVTSGNKGSILWDGVNVDQLTNIRTGTTASGPITLGSRGSSWEPFQGSLDEFRVYAGRALTAADISSSYNTQVTVDSFLVLSLTFDDTSDLKLDSSCGGSSDATSSTATSTTGKLCGAASATATVCPV